jgi:hypothetical protein
MASMANIETSDHHGMSPALEGGAQHDAQPASLNEGSGLNEQSSEINELRQIHLVSLSFASHPDWFRYHEAPKAAPAWRYSGFA